MDYLFTKVLHSRVLRALTVVLQALVMAAGCSRSPSEDTRPVRIIVGMSPGGGQDLYARVIAAHLGRHLPGTPTVVVENMPGAGGLIAANFLARRATPDGLTLGLIDGRAAVETLVESTPAVDVRDLTIIGSPAGDDVVCAFSRASGFTLDLWRGGRVPRIGMTSRDSMGAAYALLVSSALGAPTKPVVGYSGSADIRAAMVSGEVDGVCMGRTSMIASFQPLDAYLAAIQLQESKDDVLPDAAVAQAIVSSPRGRSLLDVAGAIAQLARYLVLPPNVPQTRVDAVREAFSKTMTDPQFIEAARGARLNVDPVAAEELERVIQRLLNLPPDVRRDVLSLMKTDGPS